jgi:site-specific recombinase XerD
MSELLPQPTSVAPHTVSPGRRRGRPPGALSRVVRDDRRLGLHHFAFLRAIQQGLELRAAHARYLAWSDSTSDLRHIEHEHKRLLAAVRSASLQLALSLPSGHPSVALLAPLQERSAGRATCRVRQLPTLEQWAAEAGLDPDFYTEAELLAEYRVAHRLDEAPAESIELRATPESSDDVLKALNHAELLLAAKPRPQDQLSLWYAKPIASCLRAASLETVGDLVERVRRRGPRWWTRTGIGARRAARVLDWLRSQGLYEGQAPVVGELVADASQARYRFGLVPLEHLAVPPALTGAKGLFRRHGPNTLGADHDIEAVEAWLQSHRERPSTHRSYRKEVERFVLWCAHVLGKPLSSATSIDCMDYRAFLANVPAQWVAEMPVRRMSSAWRPFRGQPSPASQKLALTVVQAMYEGLVATGYLEANPMRAVMRTFNLPASHVRVQRSFSAAEVSHIRSMLEREAPGPLARRLRAILELLLATGVRLDELAKARHADLRQVEVDGEAAKAWVVTVTGKRRKQREVPVPDAVVAMLREHAHDAAAEIKPELPLVWSMARAPGGAKIEGGLAKAGGSSPAPLSPSGLYATLKRFLRRCARGASEAGLEAAHLACASTHWLRHTFGRRAAVAQVPLEVIGQAMGHASLSTTTVYLSQERSRMIRELRKVV